MSRESRGQCLPETLQVPGVILGFSWWCEFPGSPWLGACLLQVLSRYERKEGWVTLCRNPLLGGYPLGIWSLEPRGYDRCQQMPKQVQESPESPELNPKFINTFVIIELLFFLNLRNEKKKKKKPYCSVPVLKYYEPSLPPEIQQV